MNPILKSAIMRDIGLVNSTLSNMIKPESKLSFDVYKQVVDSGKRLRPLIVFYSALSLGLSDKNSALRLGCIIELIHTASLLHDDIIDDANVRRGKASANVVFGVKPAVLGGDYLYSLAFNMVLSFDKEIARVISKAAYLLAEGEIKEVENSFRIDISVEDYYDVIYKKTAVLLEASSISGSILADADYQDNFMEYGKNIGFAFQIKDDCLDYESDMDTLGKNAGMDLKEGKITLPILYAAEQDKHLMDDVGEFFKSKNADLLYSITGRVKKLGLKASVEEAKKFSKKAKSSIMMLPDSRYKDYLIAIADYAVERTR